jgi:hypothetical protein
MDGISVEHGVNILEQVQNWRESPRIWYVLNPYKERHAAGGVWILLGPYNNSRQSLVRLPLLGADRSPYRA